MKIYLGTLMAITNQQKNNMLGIVVGLFNASPGSKFLADFTTIIEGGTTEAQLADTLAATTVFTNDIMGGKTVTAQVTELMNHYGLVADNIAGSPATQAANFFANSLNSGIGFGSIVFQATSFLLGSSVPAEFTQTANLLKNKIAVADVHSAHILSIDLATLQGPMFGLDGTSVLSSAAATNYLVTNGFLFRITTNSATLDEATIGPLAGPVGVIDVPDNFTINLVSANNNTGLGGAFDVVGNISVTPLNAAGTTAGGNAESFTLNATINDGNANGAAEGINAQTMIINGVENLFISSNVASTDGSSPDTNPAAHTLTAKIIAPEAEAITITGNGGVNLEANAGLLSELTIGKVTAINASGSTGNIDISLAAHARSVIYTGSSGRDDYAGSTQGDIITGGQGGDFIILEAAKAAQDVLRLNSAIDAQISDTNNDGSITILEDINFEMVENFTAGTAATADLFDVRGLAFTGTQQGIVDVAAKVPTFDTNLTSIVDLFSDTAGDRGVAFSEIPLPLQPGESQTIMFIDANKDGNLTAADDIVIEVMGAGPLAVENFLF